VAEQEDNPKAENMIIEDAATPQPVVVELSQELHVMPESRLTRSYMKEENQPEQEQPIYKEAHVSFIQVVRNYFRLSVKQMTAKDYLKNLYESGCAVYLYENYNDIDMLASIRLTPMIGGDFVYAPLLVSVQTQAKAGNQVGPLDQMTKLLSDAGTCGICIQLLFDSPDLNPSENQCLSAEDVNCLLREEVVSKVVVVDENDPFGIVKTLLRTTSIGPARAGVYSSHEFANLQCLTIEPKKLVGGESEEELVQYVQNLTSKKLSIRKSKRICEANLQSLTIEPRKLVRGEIEEELEQYVTAKKLSIRKKKRTYEETL
jgi:hypothetical protein